MKAITNPLTMLGLFATVSEGLAIGLVPHLHGWHQDWVVGFAILYPIGLTTFFGFMLNRSPEKLYSPSDYRTDEAFLASQDRMAISDLSQAIENAIEKSKDPSDEAVIYSQQFIHNIKGGMLSENCKSENKILSFFNLEPGSFYTARAVSHILTISHSQAKELLEHLVEKDLLLSGVDPGDGVTLFGVNRGV